MLVGRRLDCSIRSVSASGRRRKPPPWEASFLNEDPGVARSGLSLAAGLKINADGEAVPAHSLSPAFLQWRCPKEEAVPCELVRTEWMSWCGTLMGLEIRPSLRPLGSAFRIAAKTLLEGSRFSAQTQQCLQRTLGNPLLGRLFSANGWSGLLPRTSQVCEVPHRGRVVSKVQRKRERLPLFR